MPRRIFAAAALLLTAPTPASADLFCDTLLAYIHDAPKNAVITKTIADRSGPQTVAQSQLEGARCLVASWNPTGVVVDHVAQQSVNCYWQANDDKYSSLLLNLSTRVAACLSQPAQGDSFHTRFEYDTNYGAVRVAADQMADDWAVSIAIEPN